MLFRSQGALVSQVTEGSAAEKAGIKVNDIITSINGQPVRSAAELRNNIGMLRIGDKLEIGLVREGKPRKVAAVIGARTEATTAAAGPGSAVEGIHPALEGAHFADGGNGVVVEDVEPGSRAADSGLRPNDVIVGVNRARITSANQLRDAAKGQNVLLLNIKRGNILLALPVR